MEEIILLLYLKDVEYGKRLLRFLSGKKNPGLYLELITVKKGVDTHIGNVGQKIVVLTDDLGIKEDEKRNVIYLCNEQDRGKKRIFQYQKAERIYQEIVKILSLKTIEKEDDQEEFESKKGIYCVFSPDGTGSTLVSVLLSQYLGGKGKCLYISLAGFPLFYEAELKSEPDFTRSGMGELLFSINQENFAEREQMTRQKFGNGYMLGPMVHFKDILDCGAEEWQRFLERLQNDCGYDSIVVEMGQIFENILDFLELGDRIFIIQGQGIFGRIRKAVFRRYCQMESKDILEKKSHYVDFTREIQEWEREFSEQTVEELADDRKKMMYVEKIFEGIGGEDDVCIIEDFT